MASQSITAHEAVPGCIAGPSSRPTTCDPWQQQLHNRRDGARVRTLERGHGHTVRGCCRRRTVPAETPPWQRGGATAQSFLGLVDDSQAGPGLQHWPPATVLIQSWSYTDTSSGPAKYQVNTSPRMRI